MEPTLTTRLQAEGVALALETFAKEKPIVNYQADGTADVYFTPEQVPRLRAKLEDVLKQKALVRVHAEPIIVPVILKKTWPVILGIALAGFMAGSTLSRRKRR